MVKACTIELADDQGEQHGDDDRLRRTRAGATSPAGHRERRHHLAVGEGRRLLAVLGPIDRGRRS